MAGIGFQLKKLFRKRGIFARIVAVGYTGMITTGPLILGLAFLMLVSWLGQAAGVSASEVEKMLVMVTYALIASQVVNGIFSMVLTRYVSDMLYEERGETVVPSLVGALALVLPVSGVLYLVFLLFSGMDAGLVLLNELLFLELVASWMEMSYLTAVKDYRGVLGVYAVAIAVSLAVVWALCAAGLASLTALLSCVCLGYGLMMALDMGLLSNSFPGGKGACFAWMAWLDRYPTLVGVGFFTAFGLFAHLVIDWSDPVMGRQVFGLFYASPAYDIPALYAVLSMIPTTVMFTAITETEFYPYYRGYFDLLNGTGSIGQVDEAQTEMESVLRREVSRLARIQMLCTVCIIAFGVPVLNVLPLGFTPFMDGRFIFLTLGYSTFAIGNVLGLLLMYFSDYKDALLASGVFAACVLVTSIAAQFIIVDLIGLGFLVSSVVYLAIAWWRLHHYLGTLPGAILLEQPFVTDVAKEGVFERLGDRLERKL